jgi:ADP-ribosylglycohydrolase
MLLEIAIADAYGHGFEYAPPDETRKNDGETHCQHPRHLRLLPGMYTDDAQMSMAVAQVVLSGEVSPETFADAFVDRFKADPRDGYARGFQAFLEGVSDGADFLARIRPDSEKGGAAMRAGPIGLLPDIERIIAVAELQARLTHDTVKGRASSKAVALMVHHVARRLGPLSELPAFLSAKAPEIDWTDIHRGKVGQDGDQLVRAALGVLLDGNSLSDALVRSVSLGGDTDTLAAVVMAVASVSAEKKRDIHPKLVNGLENGPFGRDHLKAIDATLAKRFRLPIVSVGPSEEFA